MADAWSNDEFRSTNAARQFAPQYRPVLDDASRLHRARLKSLASSSFTIRDPLRSPVLQRCLRPKGGIIEQPALSF
jgi:hypothetical protein